MEHGPRADSAEMSPESFRVLIEDIASGVESVRTLSALAIHDGVSDPAAAELIVPLVEAMSRLDGAELVAAVDLIWELTVDPVVRSTESVKVFWTLSVLVVV